MGNTHLFLCMFEHEAAGVQIFSEGPGKSKYNLINMCDRYFLGFHFKKISSKSSKNSLNRRTYNFIYNDFILLKPERKV